MLVAAPPAMSYDAAIQLARRMQELVYKEFGLLLVPECQFVGFKEYPLHTRETIEVIMCHSGFFPENLS